MKKAALSALILTFTILSSPSQAAELDLSRGKPEGGVHLSVFDVDHISTMIGVIGYLGHKVDFKQQVSIIPEIRLGTGLSSGELENTKLSSHEYDISYFFSTGIKTQFEINSQLYANAGLSLNKYKYKIQSSYDSAHLQNRTHTYSSNLKLGLSLGGGYKLPEGIVVDARLDFVDKINLYSVGVIMAF